MNFRCILGHKWQLIKRYDNFNVYYTDYKYRQYFLVKCYKCKLCEKRKVIDNYPFWGSDPHAGIEIAKSDWIDFGKIHNYTQKSTTDNIQSYKRTDRIENLLEKALQTDSDSEALNCLKLARREYKK